MYYPDLVAVTFFTHFLPPQTGEPKKLAKTLRLRSAQNLVAVTFFLGLFSAFFLTLFCRLFSNGYTSVLAHHLALRGNFGMPNKCERPKNDR